MTQATARIPATHRIAATHRQATPSRGSNPLAPGQFPSMAAVFSVLGVAGASLVSQYMQPTDYMTSFTASIGTFNNIIHTLGGLGHLSYFYTSYGLAASGVGGVQTFLNGGITGTQANFIVTAMPQQGFPQTAFVVQIDTEQIALPANTTTVNWANASRGVNGTTKAAHADQATVFSTATTVPVFTGSIGAIGYDFERFSATPSIEQVALPGIVATFSALCRSQGFLFYIAPEMVFSSAGAASFAPWTDLYIIQVGKGAQANLTPSNTGSYPYLVNTVSAAIRSVNGSVGIFASLRTGAGAQQMFAAIQTVANVVTGFSTDLTVQSDFTSFMHLMRGV